MTIPFLTNAHYANESGMRVKLEQIAVRLNRLKAYDRVNLLDKTKIRPFPQRRPLIFSYREMV